VKIPFHIHNTHSGTLQHGSLLEHTFIGLNYWKINYISTLSCLVVADYKIMQWPYWSNRQHFLEKLQFPCRAAQWS